MIGVVMPGRKPIRIGHVVFDFDGTLALDGVLLPDTVSRLKALAKLVPVTVLTADTFGTARAALRSLPVSLHTIRGGSEKARFIARWRRPGVAAIGNGSNDGPMLRAATLSIAILGPEGLSPVALAAATVVVSDVRSAIGLLLEPKRLVATLRR